MKWLSASHAPIARLLLRTLLAVGLLSDQGTATPNTLGRVQEFENELSSKGNLGALKVPHEHNGLIQFPADTARNPITVIPSKAAYEALGEMKKTFVPPGQNPHPPPIELRSLARGISRADLNYVRLNEVAAGCTGSVPTCPASGPCGGPSGGVVACHSSIYSQLKRRKEEARLCGDHTEGSKEEGEPGGLCKRLQEPGAQYLTVFELKDVYVASNGLTFNRSSLWSRSGCIMDKPFSFPEGHSPVVHVDSALSVVYLHGYAYFHNLIEVLPTMLAAAPILQADPSFPILMKCAQWLYYLFMLEPLLGVPASDLNVVCIDGKELIHANRVLQPIFPECGTPKADLYFHLRRHFFLNPGGIPMFAPGWKLRGQTPLSEEEMARVPADWLVVFGRRPGRERRIEGGERILDALVALFGSERVSIFDGSQSILTVREMFNRAVLYVGPHGAGMSTMIFMPSGSFVLELRPLKWTNPCYAHLAKACSLRYHALWGEGDKHSPLLLNITEVVKELGLLFHNITHRVRPRQHP